MPDRFSNLPSLGTGINPGALPDSPVPTPYQSGKLDPQAQRRWLLLEDKKRNWLLENAAKANSPRKDGGAEEFSSERPGPTDSLSKISADRLRRATERRDPKDEQAEAAKETTAFGNETEADEAKGKKHARDEGSADPSAPKPATAFAIGNPGDPERAAETTRPSLGNDFFVTPGLGGVDERQRERIAVRGAEFDQMLGGIGQNAVPGGLDLSRATPDRARRFEAILGGGDAGGGLASPQPFAAAAAPPRPDFSPALGRVNPIQLPGSTPAPPPAAAPKFQPRPIFLQIPTRGL